MRKSIGLIGEPAVGKTTVMRKVIDGLQFKPYKLDLAKWMECEEQKLVLMGSYSGHTFDGTDRLGFGCYSDLETMLQYFQQSATLSTYNILWEGDRLTRRRWFDALALHGYELKLFHLRADLDTVNERRRRRGAATKTPWIKSRKSLCERFAAEYSAEEFVIHDETAADRFAELLQHKIGAGDAT